jgi:hypothetical protein
LIVNISMLCANFLALRHTPQRPFRSH